MKPLVILTGPTSVGKTKLSIELAKRIHGEIISADSMQVYREMNIGTAKITKEEMQGIPHHMIDILDPKESFNVVTFQKLCKEYMEEIYKRDAIPIVVGGTGFYIQAILRDIDFTENEDDTAYRDSLMHLAEEKGAEYLHEMLLKVDEKAAEEIHANNIKRTIRALEYYHLTGQKISEHNEQEKQKQNAYNSIYFVLNDERDLLYKRIEDRIDIMIRDGLIEEVQKLKEKGCTSELISMQGLGYKEILRYLDGECSLEEAVYILKRDTRHFAKRQLTWFRREKDICWIQKNEFGYDDEKMLEFMMEKLKEQRIIK